MSTHACNPHTCPPHHPVGWLGKGTLCWLAACTHVCNSTHTHTCMLAGRRPQRRRSLHHCLAGAPGPPLRQPRGEPSEPEAYRHLIPLLSHPPSTASCSHARTHARTHVVRTRSQAPIHPHPHTLSVQHPAHTHARAHARRRWPPPSPTPPPSSRRAASSGSSEWLPTLILPPLLRPLPSPLTVTFSPPTSQPSYSLPASSQPFIPFIPFPSFPSIHLFPFIPSPQGGRAPPPPSRRSSSRRASRSRSVSARTQGGGHGRGCWSTQAQLKLSSV